jgi:hypothetical protein
VENNANMLMYQTEDGQTKINVRLEDETVWMTQKAIAELFQTTPQNITLHIKDLLLRLEKKVYTRCYRITRQEGSRIINRELTHYHLDVVINIAMKSHKFEEINRFLEYLTGKSITPTTLHVVPIKERNFEELLIGSLSGVVEIITQFRVSNYFVDFYLPKEKLVIEFDENHHKKRSEIDKTRQIFI